MTVIKYKIGDYDCAIKESDDHHRVCINNLCFAVFGGIEKAKTELKTHILRDLNADNIFYERNIKSKRQEIERLESDIVSTADILKVLNSWSNKNSINNFQQKQNDIYDLNKR